MNFLFKKSVFSNFSIRSEKVFCLVELINACSSENLICCNFFLIF